MRSRAPATPPPTIESLTQELVRERTLRVEAERASRMKDDFLATLSHELRTPLNAILGWTQTVQRDDAPREALVHALTQIRQSATAQAKLVEDLLHISDIVAGRVRLDMQPMRLRHAVTAVIEALSPSFEAKGIRLETWMDPSLDIVRADPVRLQQVVWNLLANAIKFTPHEGAVRVTLAREDGCAALAICDSGEGISPEFLPHVFDRFSQADASSRKRHGGLGIGLAIARSLVQLHGGTIEAYSAGPGTGARFVVRLPVPAVADSLPPQPRDCAPVRAPSKRRSLAGIRVLSVDDDQNTREMLEEALKQAGAEVLTADCARDALRKLPCFRPHVLVSDIGMPNEDGHDLLRAIRRLPREEGGATPAIALTGFARDEDRLATWRAGYQAVTPKPVNLAELFETIASLAGHTETQPI